MPTAPTAPTWITLFLDFPADTYEQGIEFWRAVTGYRVSARRGPDGQLATLVPHVGDGHLRVQRLDDGPARIHVDVHVDDVGAAVPVAVGLGAEVTAHGDGFTVLRSPGGLVFCLVPSGESRRAAPQTWPGGHRSIVDQVCLDVPTRRCAAEAAFWAGLTGWEFRAPTPGNEFGSFRRPAGQPVRFLLQRLDDDGPVTAHLDLAATDRDAEVVRHRMLGARTIRRTAKWTVLADPTGRVYCVTDRDPDTGMPPP